MPRYDYECEQCQSVFEVRASIKEKEVGLSPVCPKCQSQTVHQIITAGLVLRKIDGNTMPSSGCGPNAKPGCCG